VQLQGVITIRGDSAPALAHGVDLYFQIKVGITMILDLPFCSGERSWFIIWWGWYDVV